jgi:hypothetical protein
VAAQTAIHVLPGQHDDWIVREDRGRELGHYPTRQAAEAVGHKVARKRRVELLVHDRNGQVQSRSRPARSWLARLLGR